MHHLDHMQISYTLLQTNNHDSTSPLSFNTLDALPAGSVKSTVDYIIVQQYDKAKVPNVKDMPDEECVPKCKLIVMYMQFKTRKPIANAK